MTVTDQIVTIDAAVEIPEWQVREFYRMPIYIGECRFFLRNKAPAQPPFAFRYTLERWPAGEEFSTARSSFTTYDEEFVRDRDAEHARRQRCDKLGRAMMVLYPVLGFLWSGAKRRLIPFGFIPRSITGVSIFTGGFLLLLQAIFSRMQLGFFSFLFGDLAAFKFWLFAADHLLLAFLLIDCVLRLDQHIKGVEHPWGFCEWLAAPFRGKAFKRGDQF